MRHVSIFPHLGLYELQQVISMEMGKPNFESFQMSQDADEYTIVIIYNDILNQNMPSAPTSMPPAYVRPAYGIGAYPSHPFQQSYPPQANVPHQIVEQMSQIMGMINTLTQQYEEIRRLFGNDIIDHK